MEIGIGVLLVVILLLFAILSVSIKTVRPTDRGLVERFGKYHRFAPPGLTFIIPFGIERMIKINVTEMMVDAGGQEIITKDSLNAKVDAQVYFKVKTDEEEVVKSLGV